MDTRTHVIDERREIVTPDDEPFDRMEFAMRAVRMIKPPTMTVMVYESCSRVKFERGRDLRRGTEATWGILAVPRYATRAEIIMAVASLAGRPAEPFVMDTLLTWEASPV